MKVVYAIARKAREEALAILNGGDKSFTIFPARTSPRGQRKKLSPPPPHGRTLRAMTQIPRANGEASKSAVSRSKDERASAADAERRAELAALLPLWPRELADLSIAGRCHIVKTLERALRGERKRGRAGHWTYDVARHAALLRTYRAECQSLAALRIREAARRCRPRRRVQKTRPLAGGRAQN